MERKTTSFDLALSVWHLVSFTSPLNVIQDLRKLWTTQPSLPTVANHFKIKNEKLKYRRLHLATKFWQEIVSIAVDKENGQIWSDSNMLGDVLSKWST